MEIINGGICIHIINGVISNQCSRGCSYCSRSYGEKKINMLDIDNYISSLDKIQEYVGFDYIGFGNDFGENINFYIDLIPRLEKLDKNIIFTIDNENYGYIESIIDNNLFDINQGVVVLNIGYKNLIDISVNSLSKWISLSKDIKNILFRITVNNNYDSYDIYNGSLVLFNNFIEVYNYFINNKSSNISISFIGLEKFFSDLKNKDFVSNEINFDIFKKTVLESIFPLKYCYLFDKIKLDNDIINTKLDIEVDQDYNLFNHHSICSYHFGNIKKDSKLEFFKKLAELRKYTNLLEKEYSKKKYKLPICMYCKNNKKHHNR